MIPLPNPIAISHRVQSHGFELRTITVQVDQDHVDIRFSHCAEDGARLDRETRLPSSLTLTGEPAQAFRASADWIAAAEQAVLEHLGD